MTKTKKPNKIIYSDENEVHLEVNGNRVLVVDADDYDKIKDYRWCVYDKGGYCKVHHTSNKGSPVSLARYLMDAPKGMYVDHINHNPLDNRRSNLRVCTAADNSRNKRVIAKESSQYKGVSRDSTNKNLYKANITVNDNQMHLGAFQLEIDAALAYNEAAIKYHGEFACLNEVVVPEGFVSEYTIDGSYLKYRDKFWRKSRSITQNKVTYHDEHTVKFTVGTIAEPESCIVDAEKYDLIKDRFWEFSQSKQAVVDRAAKSGGMRLSRVLLPHDDGCYVEHRNGNRYDFRIENLVIRDNNRNEVVFNDGIEAHIKLYNDMVFKVDAANLDKVILHSWCVETDKPSKSIKVYTKINGIKINIRKYLFNYSDDLQPYHINDDRLDFRRENLEFLSYKELSNRYATPRSKPEIIYQGTLIAKLKITESLTVTVDREDLDKIMKFSWKLSRKGYLETRQSPYKDIGITLQRFIMNSDPTIRRVEFKTDDRTDYRKENLICRY